VSDSSGTTQYQISGNLGDDSYGVTLTDPAMTDAVALGIAEAFRTMALPAGMTRSVAIFKTVQNAVTTTANLADPNPVFF
jgi:hypothetical protein